MNDYSEIIITIDNHKFYVDFITDDITYITKYKSFYIENIWTDFVEKILTIGKSYADKEDEYIADEILNNRNIYEQLLIKIDKYKLLL